VIGFHFDHSLYALDVLLHGRMGWEWLAPALARPRFVRAFDVLYLMWFPAMLLFMLWCSWTSDRVLRQRALTAFVLVWIVAGSVAAALLSSAGPVYYGDVVAGPNPYAPLIERLDAIQASGRTVFARATEHMLWVGAQDPGRWHETGGISAMPSLHVAVAVLFFLVAYERSRILTIVTALFAVGIQISSVGLAWHYPMDGYVGAGLTALCWWGAGRLQSAKDLDAALHVEAIINRCRGRQTSSANPSAMSQPHRNSVPT
jgi:hypothetical protein